jgi:hypothetical protein
MTREGPDLGQGGEVALVLEVGRGRIAPWRLLKVNSAFP